MNLFKSILKLFADTFNIVDKLNKEKSIVEPEIIASLDINTVREVLNHALRNTDIYLADPLYSVPSLDSLKTFLKQDKTNLNKYSEDFDCDDFSVALYYHLKKWRSDICAGILWIKAPFAHALNIALVADSKGDIKVAIIEPQNDLIYEVPKSYRGWLILI